MGRQIASVAVSATIFAALVCGCGPRDVAQTGPQVAAPVTLEVKSKPTTAPTSPWDRVQFRPVEYKTFVDEWRSNPSAADAKYNGKPVGVEVVGVIAGISVNAERQTVVQVGDGMYVGVLTDTAKESLNKFKVGDRVKVLAVSSGVTLATPYLQAYKFTSE